jgi:hypothetical protein
MPGRLVPACLAGIVVAGKASRVYSAERMIVRLAFSLPYSSWVS